MDNNLAEVAFITKKIVANPKKVLFTLPIKRDTRPYPRMNKKKIFAEKRVFEVVQKFEMSALAHCETESRGQRFLFFRIPMALWRYSIRPQRIESSVLKPLR